MLADAIEDEEQVELPHRAHIRATRRGRRIFGLACARAAHQPPHWMIHDANSVVGVRFLAFGKSNSTQDLVC
jgi:hypothetical protein